MTWRAVLAASADLAWGGACAACGSPGPVLCAACVGSLRSLPVAPVRTRHPVPPTMARGDYTDGLRAVLLACKERQGLSLVPLLAELVTISAVALVHERWDGGALRVVPIPSSRSTVASRGFDLTRRMAVRVAGTLRRERLEAHVWPALRQVRASRDQAGLGVAERLENRRATMVARAAVPATILLIDDIVTTGATLTEASRALSGAGHTVLGAAVVAATPRRSEHG